MSGQVVSDAGSQVLYMYSGTSDNGHSEKWTTSLERTNCLLAASFSPYIMYMSRV